MLFLHVLMIDSAGISWIYRAGLSGPLRSFTLRNAAGSDHGHVHIFIIMALRQSPFSLLLLSLTGTFKLHVSKEDDPNAV